MSITTRQILVALGLLTLGLVPVACNEPGGEASSHGGPGGSGGSREARVFASSLGGAGSYAAVSLDNIEAFTAPAYAFTQIPYTTELYDVRGIDFDVTTHRFSTSPDDVYFQVCASLASFGQDFEIDIFVNDVRENAIAMSRSGVASGCRTLRVAGYLDIRIYHEGSAPLSFSPNCQWNWLTIHPARPVTSLDDTEPVDASSGQFAKLPYTSLLFESYGPGPAFNPETHQETTCGRPPCDWQVCASAASLTQDFELDLFVNNAREKAFAVSKYGAGGGCRMVRTTQASDVLDVRLYQNSVPVMPLPHNSFWNWANFDTVHILVSAGNIPAMNVFNKLFAVVRYNNEVIDERAEYNPQTGRFTASTAGYYQFCASLASFVQGFELDLFVNGVREKGFAVSSYGAADGCRTVHLFAGDYADVRVYQGSGSTMAFQPNDYWNWLTVAQRRPE